MQFHINKFILESEKSLYIWKHLQGQCTLLIYFDTIFTYSAAANQLQVTLLLTLFVSDYDYNQGGSPVTSATLSEVAQTLSNAADDVNTPGVTIPANEIERFGMSF